MSLYARHCCYEPEGPQRDFMAWTGVRMAGLRPQSLRTISAGAARIDKRESDQCALHDGRIVAL